MTNPTNEMLRLPFGKGLLDLRLPPEARATIVRRGVLPGLKDPSAAVRDALDHPVDAESLRKLARGRRSACILICDITRPVPNHLFLRPIIEDLTAAGVPVDSICILVATGFHRPNEGDELAELVGDPWVLATVRVENHFARNDADHVDMGVTSTRGTPVKLDRRFIDADLKIVTGLVEPHFMAGYSGGRKVIVPGIAHADTIKTIHGARFLEDPMARVCNLGANPLHEEQLEIVKMIGEVYALNTVLNEDRELAYVNFGEIVESHTAAVEIAARSCIVNVGRTFNTVISSSAGYPLDKTYYQTIKAMVTPLDILKPGGTLIVASECLEGLGSDEFRAALQSLVENGTEGFLNALIGRNFAAVDEWQTEMQMRAMRRVRLQLYSTGLDQQSRKLTCVDSVKCVEQAIEESIRRTGDTEIAVIPEGPYVIPLSQANA